MGERLLLRRGMPKGWNRRQVKVARKFFRGHWYRRMKKAREVAAGGDSDGDDDDDEEHGVGYEEQSDTELEDASSMSEHEMDTDEERDAAALHPADVIGMVGGVVDSIKDHETGLHACDGFCSHGGALVRINPGPSTS